MSFFPAWILEVIDAQLFLSVNISKSQFLDDKNLQEQKSRRNVSSRSVLFIQPWGEGGWRLSLNGTCGKSCSYTTCLLVINNSIMFPWVPLFAFERGSITFPDCNACKQIQVGSVYICTLPDHVFPLLTSYIMP